MAIFLNSKLSSNSSFVVVAVVVHKLESFFASLNLTRHPHLSLWVFSPILYALITIILFDQQFQMIGRRRGSSDSNNSNREKKLSNCRISLNDDMFASTTINYRLVPFFGPNRERKHNTNTIRSDPFGRLFAPTVRSFAWSIARSLVAWFIHSFVRSFVCLFVVPFQSLIFNYRYNIPIYLYPSESKR